MSSYMLTFGSVKVEHLRVWTNKLPSSVLALCSAGHCYLPASDHHRMVVNTASGALRGLAQTQALGLHPAGDLVFVLHSLCPGCSGSRYVEDPYGL